MTLASAASVFSAPDAATALTADHFVDGYQQAWLDPSTSGFVGTFLWRFGSDTGAADFAGRVGGAIRALPAEHPITTTGVPGAIAASVLLLGHPALFAVYSFAKYAVEVKIVGNDATTQLLQQLTTTQLALLAA